VDGSVAAPWVLLSAPCPTPPPFPLVLGAAAPPFPLVLGPAAPPALPVFGTVCALGWVGGGAPLLLLLLRCVGHVAAEGVVACGVVVVVVGVLRCATSQGVVLRNTASELGAVQ